MKANMNNYTPHISECQRKILFAGWLACLCSGRYCANARSG